jgi:hypothetical protein
LPERRETIYVLIGDHQPTANITGERPPWDVPVHIISRDAALLDRFKAQGFSEGLWPDRTVLGGIHHLTSLLLSAFGPAPRGPERAIEPNPRHAARLIPHRFGRPVVSRVQMRRAVALLTIATVHRRANLLVWALFHGQHEAPDHIGPVAGFSYSGADRWESPIEGERPSATDLDRDLALAVAPHAAHPHLYRGRPSGAARDRPQARPAGDAGCMAQ